MNILGPIKDIPVVESVSIRKPPVNYRPKVEVVSWTQQDDVRSSTLELVVRGPWDEAARLFKCAKFCFRKLFWMPERMSVKRVGLGYEYTISSRQVIAFADMLYGKLPLRVVRID